VDALASSRTWRMARATGSQHHHDLLHRRGCRRAHHPAHLRRTPRPPPRGAHLSHARLHWFLTSPLFPVRVLDSWIGNASSSSCRGTERQCVLRQRPPGEVERRTAGTVTARWWDYRGTAKEKPRRRRRASRAWRTGRAAS
jgi:hypothetical protein